MSRELRVRMATLLFNSSYSSEAPLVFSQGGTGPVAKLGIIGIQCWSDVTL